MSGLVSSFAGDQAEHPPGARRDLFLDPGSSSCGWCAARPVASGAFVVEDAGLVLPDRRSAKHAYIRIDDVRRAFVELLEAMRPARIIVEVTSGKVNRRRHRGAGAGLAIHGVAVGSLWTAALMWQPPEGVERPVVEPVPENLWTQGIGKAKRARIAERVFGHYDRDQDPGLDAADAIALASWYYTVWLPKQKERAH